MIITILEERTKLLEMVDAEWAEREKRLAAEEDSGNNASGDGSEDSSESDDNIFECITKVHVNSLLFFNFGFPLSSVLNTFNVSGEEYTSLSVL